MSQSILIIGTPRSGTTWVFDVLASAANVTSVLEPDNEKVSLLARVSKGHLPRYPTLQPGTADGDFLTLWRRARFHPLASWLGTNQLLRSLEGVALNGEKLVDRKEQAALRKFSQHPETIGLNPEVASPAAASTGSQSRHRLVKSVHAVFAAEWIAHLVPWDKIMLVQRMPHGILASMKKLAMSDAVRSGSLAPHLSDEERDAMLKCSTSPELYFSSAAVQLAKMYAWMEQLRRRHADWILATHEDLCGDPVDRFRSLFASVQLEWSEKIESGIRDRDRPGEGFATVRKASDQIGKWKKSLSADEIVSIDRIFARHGLEQWTSDGTMAGLRS